MQIILLILFSIFSFQSVKADGLLGMGIEGRMSKDDEGNFKTHFPFLVFGGYKKVPWVFLGEASYFSEKASSSYAFNIETKHYELSASAIRFLSYEEGRVVSPYVIGGVTAMQDHVTQSFSGIQSNSNSQYYAALKAGAGLWAQFLDHGFATTEFKAMYSADYAPQLVFGLTVRLGYEF